MNVCASVRQEMHLEQRLDQKAPIVARVRTKYVRLPIFIQMANVHDLHLQGQRLERAHLEVHT